MSFGATEKELEELFSEVGEVAEISMPLDRSTGHPRGFAFVNFTVEAAATEAIKRFNGYELQGRNLRVSEAQERQQRSASFFDAGPSRVNQGQRQSRPKGSRRNIRARKRGY